ncbi:MAG TPA: prepilin peptidase [Candidatus Baltobacteraceae bacterium]|nr:prepilin peptidase [Candidatus Baltobacteraceae bacterium]
MIVSAVFGSVLFACLASAATIAAGLVTQNVTPFDDGPPPGRPPSAILIVAATAIGAVLGLHGLTTADLAAAAFGTAFLVACWCADVRAGIVPDLFTLLPLGAILATQLAHGAFPILLSVLVPALPFAAGALLSKGRGIGWGDVKLAALGGAMVGLTDAIVAMGFASLVCGLSAKFVAKRGGAVAFAPFLTGAIGLALVLRVVLA